MSEYADWSEVCGRKDAVLIYGKESEDQCQNATYRHGGAFWGKYRINDPVDATLSGRHWWRCCSPANEGERYCGIHLKIRAGEFEQRGSSRDRRRASKIGPPDSPVSFHRYERFGEEKR